MINTSSAPTGEAVLTPGFNLPAKYIAHAVGPVWKGGKQNEEKLLYHCYQHSMKLAYQKGCHSIAFPLISSGIYGYPAEQAWRVAIQAIHESPCPMDVTIAVISDKALALGNQVLAEASPYDKIWGIGLDAANPDSADPTKWKGDNLLGKILRRIREELRSSK